MKKLLHQQLSEGDKEQNKKTLFAIILAAFGLLLFIALALTLPL